MARLKSGPAAASTHTVAEASARQTGAGNVTDSQIASQINVLNQAYAGNSGTAAAKTPFSFRLVATD